MVGSSTSLLSSTVAMMTACVELAGLEGRAGRDLLLMAFQIVEMPLGPLDLLVRYLAGLDVGRQAVPIQLHVLLHGAVAGQRPGGIGDRAHEKYQQVAQNEEHGRGDVYQAQDNSGMSRRVQLSAPGRISKNR